MSILDVDGFHVEVMELLETGYAEEPYRDVEEARHLAASSGALLRHRLDGVVARTLDAQERKDVALLFTSVQGQRAGDLAGRVFRSIVQFCVASHTPALAARRGRPDARGGGLQAPQDAPVEADGESRIPIDAFAGHESLLAVLGAIDVRVERMKIDRRSLALRLLASDELILDAAFYRVEQTRWLRANARLGVAKLKRLPLKQTGGGLLADGETWLLPHQFLVHGQVSVVDELPEEEIAEALVRRGLTVVRQGPVRQERLSKTPHQLFSRVFELAPCALEELRRTLRVVDAVPGVRILAVEWSAAPVTEAVASQSDRVESILLKLAVVSND